MSSSRVSTILETLKNSALVGLYDDASATGSAIVFGAAEKVSEALVAKILNLTGGLLCVAASETRCDSFDLYPPKPSDSTVSTTRAESETAIASQLVSVEAREGVTTGISAADRACTIAVLGSPQPAPRLLISPGHIFPISTRIGGVLVRSVLPEGAVDLVSLAGATDAAFFAELLDSKGELPSREAQINAFQKENIPYLALSDLIQYRLEKQPLVQKISEAKLPTSFGEKFRAVVYHSLLDGADHVALVKGTPKPGVTALVRVQRENPLSDIFGTTEGTQTISSRVQIQKALELIDRTIPEGSSGVFLYLRANTSSRSFMNAQQLSNEMRKNMREYGIGAQILRDLGVTHLELLSDKRPTLSGLEHFGITIVGSRRLEE